VPTDQILQLLVAERDRLNAAIGILQGGTAVRRRGRPPKNNAPAWVTGNEVASTTAPKEAPARKKRTFTAAQRKQQAARMKAYWAAKKKSAKKTAAKS
jgi:hypothetical protein